MPVRIAKAVWARWADLGEEFDQPSIDLELRLGAGPIGADAAWATALEQVHAEMDTAERRTGEWTWTPTARGLLLSVAEAWHFEDELRAIARRLGADGLRGTIGVADDSAVVVPPRKAPLVQLQVRLRGERTRPFERGYRWTPDDAALERVVASAVGWLDALPGAPARSFWTDGPAVAVARGESLVDHLLRAADAGFPSAATGAVADGVFRLVRLNVTGGAVILQEGTVAPAAGRLDGPAVAAALVAFARDHAGDVVYGFVRRGWSTEWTLTRYELKVDWPGRPDDRPYAIGHSDQAFEDVAAPDAFGVQLLGPGYAGRGPIGGSWTEEVIGDARLLRHADPSAWFSEAFSLPPDGADPNDPSPPELLVQARRELAPLLYAPGMLSAGGWALADDEL